MKETNEIKKLQKYVYLLIIAVIFVFFQSIIKNSINEKWAKDRNLVACIPDTETHFPGVYYQSAAHPLNNEAKIQQFISQYVKLTRNENYIDFHKVLEDKEGGGRYDKARVSSAKWKAIYMSKGVERKVNEGRYMKSSDMFHYLDKNKLGIQFLIDEIITMPTPKSMSVAVIVRGQYEAIYDSAEKEKKNLPPEFLGYKEFRYILETSFPETNIDDKKWDNKWGMYVVWSEEYDLSTKKKKRLEKRSRELYLQENL